MYFKIIYSNGYCGCNEEEYIIAESEDEALEWMDENVTLYGFYDDDRFVDDVDDYEDEEENDEAAWEQYHDSILENSYVVEITEEEYKEATE